MTKSCFIFNGRNVLGCLWQSRKKPTNDHSSLVVQHRKGGEIERDREREREKERDADIKIRERACIKR